jgi:hypothetical protein
VVIGTVALLPHAERLSISIHNNPMESPFSRV